jgi:hypothetical protein
MYDSAVTVQVYFQVSGNYQALEQILTAKSNRTKGSQSKNKGKKHF